MTRTIAAAAVATVLTSCAAPVPTSAVVEVGPALEFHVEVANTEQAQLEGLSGRTTLSEGTGMLFPFSDREERHVWMAAMKIPIDVAWIVDNQVLAVDTLDPCTLTDQSKCPRWTSPGDVDALLEVPAGALAAIEPGTPVIIREEHP